MATTEQHDDAARVACAVLANYDQADAGEYLGYLGLLVVTA